MRALGSVAALAAFLGLIAGDLVLASACSGTRTGNPTACNLAYDCARGETCWPVDRYATSFACLASGAGAPGDPCTNDPGAPTCGDGLACVQTSTDGGASCVPYCDPSAPSVACGSADPCVTGTTNGGAPIHVCLPIPDAGSD